MTYLQYFMLTFGIRLLISYLTDNTKVLGLFKYSEEVEVYDKKLKRFYYWSIRILLVIMNYASYILLKYSLPHLIELIKSI